MANGRIFRPDALQANSACMRRGLELLDCVRLIRDTPGAWSSITIYIEMVLAYYSHEYTYLSLTAPGVTIVADRKTICPSSQSEKKGGLYHQPGCDPHGGQRSPAAQSTGLP